nr:YoaK family protein [Planosporangium thailandense]
MPERVVTRLLLPLTAASGGLDAVCVTRLGGLFASVITGNMVQLGRAIATADARLALGATTAVGSYAIGVAIGAVPLRHRGSGWWRRHTVVSAVEVVLLAGMAAGWLATRAHPGRVTTPLLLGLAALAMGLQSAITINSGVRGASTTYLTGTLTKVAHSLTVDPHRFAAGAGGLARLAALLCGAAAGALVLHVAPLWAPLLPAAIVAAVAVSAAALTHDRQNRS